MSLKQGLKSIIQNHIGLPLFYLLRFFYTPSSKIRKSLLFRGRFRVKTSDGQAFFLFNDKYYLETDFFWLGFESHHWEAFSRRIWKTLCQEAKVVFDVGANTGVYALLAKTYNPSSRVYAFEPQPNVHTSLLRNNTINNYDISCEKIALSDREGEQPFYNYGPDTFEKLNTTGGSLNKNWKPKDQRSTQVEVMRLDSYLRQREIEKIDVLKIDVETLEFEVLNGYGKLLFEHRPIIILEIQSPTIGNKIEDLLEGNRFSYFNIDEMAGLIPVETLGALIENNRNYLLCPNEKLNQISMFEVSNSGKDHR